jgi:hypothetical protein
VLNGSRSLSNVMVVPAVPTASGVMTASGRMVLDGITVSAGACPMSPPPSGLACSQPSGSGLEGSQITPSKAAADHQPRTSTVRSSDRLSHNRVGFDRLVVTGT